MPAAKIEFDAVAPFRSDDPYAANAALSMVPTLDGNRHAYQALISTGEFRILGDSAVARAIQDYYAEVDEVRAFEADLEEVRRAVAASRHRLGVSNFAAITMGDLATIVAADAALAAELETYWTYNATHHGVATALREQATALIERIEQSR